MLRPPHPLVSNGQLDTRTGNTGEFLVPFPVSINPKTKEQGFCECGHCEPLIEMSLKPTFYSVSTTHRLGGQGPLLKPGGLVGDNWDDLDLSRGVSSRGFLLDHLPSPLRRPQFFLSRPGQ